MEGTETFGYDAIGNLISHGKPDGTQLLTWNAYGKVRPVTKGTTTMTFGYDAQQNRLKKEVKVNGVSKTSYYIRDAQGNALAVYEQKGASLIWKEQDLYGSSRLGVAKPEREMTGFFWASASYTLVAGARSYELSNHLGNVLAVISDRGELQSAQDYYPFGMAMPGRSSGSYRYGFNGKETDPETGIQDYGMRWYLPNIARFPSVDPITKKYPELTPYQFASNTPIQAIDLDGLEGYLVIVNYDATGNPQRMSIRILRDVNTNQVMNMQAQGNGLGGFNANDILRMNTGNVPTGTPRFSVGSPNTDGTPSFTANEQASINAGVDNNQLIPARQAVDDDNQTFSTGFIPGGGSPLTGFTFGIQFPTSNARIDGYEATWTTSVTPQTTIGIIRSVFPRGATGTAMLNPARTTAQFAGLINTLNADNTAQLSVRQVAVAGTSIPTLQGRDNTLTNFLIGAGVNPSQIVPLMFLPPAGIATGDVVTQLTTLNITRVFNP